MGFKFHENKPQEPLDEWIQRNKMIDDDKFFDNHIKVTIIGKPESQSESRE